MSDDQGQRWDDIIAEAERAALRALEKGEPGREPTRCEINAFAVGYLAQRIVHLENENPHPTTEAAGG